jgi:hypothetical protein
MKKALAGIEPATSTSMGYSPKRLRDVGAARLKPYQGNDYIAKQYLVMT